MMWVSDDFKEECHWAMLHHNMKISRVMVHDKHVKKARYRRKSNDAMTSRSFD